MASLWSPYPDISYRCATAVNALSYAMMGLLPQMHRDPKQIAGNISKMLGNAFGISYELPNIPNKYLQK